MTKLLIGTAMLDEAKDIIKLLNLAPVLRTTNLYTSDDKSINLIITGIGIPNTMYELTKYLLSNQDIKKVINIGYAGGYKLVKDNFYLATNCFLLDAYHTSPILNYPKYYLPGISQFKLVNNTALEGVILYSSSTFQEHIISDEKYLADMEGYAYYYLAQKFNIELEIIKYTSDIIGSDNQNIDYEDNEKSSSMKIAEFIKKHLGV